MNSLICTDMQIARNTVVTIIESIKVRAILLWHAQKWTKARAAKHSPYFARLAEAERAAAKHKVEDSDSESEDIQQDKTKTFKRQKALEGSRSLSFGTNSIGRYSGLEI